MPSGHTPPVRSLRPLLLGLVIVVGGCKSSPPPAGLISRVEGASITETELEARVQELAYHVVVVVTETAYEVFASRREPRVRRAALQLTLRLNDEAAAATFHPDPVATLIDLWTLCGQMKQHYESGDGLEDFGAQQGDVVATFEALEARCERVAATLTGDEAPPDVKQIVDDFVESHPIEGRVILRSSIAPLLATVGRRRGRSLFEINETMTQSMSELGDRLEIMQSMLPRQIAALAGFMLEIRLGELDGNEVLARLDRVEAMLDDIPGLVDEQRDLIMKAVQEERIAIMEGVEQERIAILEDVDRQRFETLEEISRELDRQMAIAFERLEAMTDDAFVQVEDLQVATIEDASGMLDRMLGSVDRQRVETLADIDTTVNAAVDRAIERVFLRIAVLLVGVFVGMLVLILFVRLLWRRPAPA